jgi:tetratricopeptide (TPR) repeat protein
MADFEGAKRAIARVVADGEGGPRKGTAFFVGGRYALTALHVVADTQTRPPTFRTSIRLHFQDAPGPMSAAVVSDMCSVEDDWAVLACERAPDAEPIELGPEPRQGSRWMAFGYPEIQEGGMTIAGEVRDPRLRPLGGAGALRGASVLQLFGEEPAAGLGAPLHGFSGAPCLVDGKAVGILRSTLIQEDVDGQQQMRLFTQAGTVHATPARNVVEWQSDRRRALLTGTWAPPEVVTQEFLVLLSAREAALDGEDGVAHLALRDVVRQAHRRLRASELGEPFFLAAADAVASEEKLEQCVRALCRAKVVVFDATDFEPAIMFLAGIRAVARRGVTLLSIGGDYYLGKDQAIPFDVKDANIVAHSLMQNTSPIADSVALLVGRIRRGLVEMSSPHYLDLPVYDVIRLLPADRRGIIPSEEGVLVLCPFDGAYEAFWNNKLMRALKNEMEALRDARRVQGQATVGVSRSFELNSPRLVSHAVYEAIRRMQSCLIDLTGWSANVLFELGVRLAATGLRTVCILERGWAQGVRPGWDAQCRALAAMLVTVDFTYAAAQPWERQKAFSNAYGVDAMGSVPRVLDGRLHDLVERALDVESEPAARPVFLELQDQAAMFSRDPGAGGRSKPVGLFPGNAALVQREEDAEFERLFAAWLYVSNRCPPRENLADPVIRNAAHAVITTLFARHAGRLDAPTQDGLSETWDAIDEWMQRNGESAPGNEVRALKARATALRNRGQFERAQDALNRAIRILEGVRDAPETPAAMAKEVRAELADTHGMRGGIFRRAGNLVGALAAYRRGRDIEVQDQETTYNLSNTITLSITLEHQSPEDPRIRADLARVIELLRIQTAGSRSDEWWAWSDLAQFHLLNGDPDAARECYAKAIRGTGATADEIKRHVAILRELERVTEATAPAIAQSIRSATIDLTQ